MTEEPGVTAPGFGCAAEVFDAQLERGLHDGAQLCVMLGGQVVLERHGGFADAGHRRRMTRHTPFMVFSATKAFTAACVHKLADEGALALDAPVAEYWPAFAARGKGGVTVGHLLLHQAGIPGEAGVADLLAWLVPGGGARRAAAMAPIHEPGARVVYHAFSAGFALGEVIRRVSGRSAARYLEEAFLEPLGMRDSSAGLPFRSQFRASRISTADPGQRPPARVFSNPLHRKAYLPAASLNASAHDLALFYDMLRAGGEAGGRRYLSARAVARAT
ncbi:MAG: beta-lactamase family protein, partial [Spirochaetaceae bacterium]|nr:beta-lactamase family protein [Spirochaetaceae bacterium]